MENKPRRPWLAVLLTIIFKSGLGHMYSGHLKRGIVLFAISLILPSISMVSLTFIDPNVSYILFLILINIAFFIFCVIDSAIVAKKGKEEYQPRKYNKWYAYIGFIIIAVLLSELCVSGIITPHFIQAFKIPVSSMEPSILIGDYLLANKRAHKIAEPERGDIIIFKYPKDPEVTYVKRLIGLPGNTIEIKGRTVYINDIPLHETYTQHINPGSITDHYGPFYIPQKGDCIEERDSTLKVNGEIIYAELVRSYQERDRRFDESYITHQNLYFMLGDNRDNSADSRFWGAVPQDYLIGKPLFIYWSFETPPDHYLRTSVSERIQRSVDVFINFFRYVRWERILQPVQ